MTFNITYNQFFNEHFDKEQKFYCNFQGIKRKDYPRWQGWSYIDKLKGEVNVSDINDEYIQYLVENMYIVMYLDYMIGLYVDQESVD